MMMWNNNNASKYPHQQQQQLPQENMTLLDLLSKCCGDNDPNTRKFASFAGKLSFFSFLFRFLHFAYIISFL
jgi:hypothetical protein